MFRFVYYSLDLNSFYLFTNRIPKKPKSKKISFVSGLQKSLHTEKKQQVFEGFGTKERPIVFEGFGTKERPIVFEGLGTKERPIVFEGLAGTKERPIIIDATIDADKKWLKMENPSVSLTDENAGQKRKRQKSTTEGGKRKKIIDEVRLLTSHSLIWFNSPLP